MPIDFLNPPRPARRPRLVDFPRADFSPTLQEGHPAQGSYRLITISSKSPDFGDVQKDGVFFVDDEGIGVLSTRLDSLAVSGEGLYVVDCPVGWSQWRGSANIAEAPRLVLDDSTEHAIFPGAVIPERYNRISCRNLPPQFSGDHNVADVPITLAVGPRGHEYRRPGLRVHRFRRTTIGSNPSIFLPNTFTSPTNFLWVEGYQFFTILYNPGNIVDVTPNYRLGLEWEYPYNVSNLERVMPFVMSQNNVTIDNTVGATDEYWPMFSFGSWNGDAGLNRGYYDLAYGTPTANTMSPAIRHGAGLAARWMRFKCFSNASNVGQSDGRSFVAYAGVYVS